MKKILTLLFTILTLNSFAQKDYSTINFIGLGTYNNNNHEIFINSQVVGSVGKQENLAYKIYSEGNIVITFICANGRSSKNIVVKNGNDYYLTMDYEMFVGLEYAIVDSAKGKELLKTVKSTTNGEEDIKNPIGKLKVKKEDDGPKQGTCFLINKQGYLLTNYHVISGAKKVQVKGIGGDFTTLYAADVVAYDIDLDLAVLKLKNETLVFEPVPYSISSAVNAQGTKSFVLGYPLTTDMGEEIKVTDGIVSAKSGYKGTISQYQISAPVQPGNSGSPLFNENGEVIGLVNAKLKGAEGAGYAIKSPYLVTFLKLVETVQMDNAKLATTATAPKAASVSKPTPAPAATTLEEKVSKFKKCIFIVQTE